MQTVAPHGSTHMDGNDDAAGSGSDDDNVDADEEEEDGLDLLSQVYVNVSVDIAVPSADELDSTGAQSFRLLFCVVDKDSGRALCGDRLWVNFRVELS